jgi:hypothetical protein
MDYHTQFAPCERTTRSGRERISFACNAIDARAMEDLYPAFPSQRISRSCSEKNGVP